MKKTKIVLTTILLAASTWLAKGQTACTTNPCTGTNTPIACERICNGGFTIKNANPSGPTQPGGGSFQEITHACGWDNFLSSFTPDYYTSGATYTSGVQVPCNFAGTQNGNFDDCYAGLLANTQSFGGGSNWREAILTGLSATLVTGKTYEVSFWISLADAYAYNALNSFGVNFTQSGSPIGTATFVNTSSVTTGGWTKFTTYHTSTLGLEDGLSIGFLVVPASTDYVLANTSTTSCGGNAVGSTYYYLDNVSVREVTTLTATASHTSGCAGEVFTLTATGVDTYTWNPGNMVAQTVTVNPSSTTVYTVMGTSNGGCVAAPTTITISPYACCTNTNSGAIHLRNVTLMPSITSTTIARPWSSLTAGNYYTGNIAVPTGSVSIITNTLSVIGGLTVNTPLTFSLSNIFFTEDAPLTQNQAMKIDRSWFRGCGKMWEGIVSKATLTVTNSFIEDAFQGINVGLWYTLSSHPGLIVENSVFLKNWAGIAVGSCSMNPGTATFKITGNVFMSRSVSDLLHDFTVGTQYNSSLLPLTARTPGKLLASTVHSITANSVRSHIGIFVPSLVSNTGSPMFTIGGVGIDQTATNKLTNLFDCMNSGIYNANSKINVYNCKFGNMINTGLGNAIGAIYHNDGTSNAKNTITVAGGGGYYKNVFGFESINSQILDAVNAYNGGTLTVNYNEFKNITRYGVSVQNWAATTPSLEPVNVANNSFTNSAYAFYAYNNQSITATVTSNTVTNSTTTYTNNANVYIDDVSKSANSTFYINNNTLKTSLNGVYARNAQNVRVVDNTIEIAKPTSTSIFNGAVWFDNVDNGFVKKNIISCNPSNATSWNTFGVFANASTTNTYKCNTITKVSACMKFQSNCYPSLNYNNSLNNVSSDPCLYGVWLDNSGQTGHIGGKTGSTYEMADIVWGYFSGADTKCQINSNYPTQYGIYYDAVKNATNYTPQVNLDNGVTDNSKLLLPISTSNALNDNTCNEQARMSGGISPTGPSKGIQNTSSDDFTLESKGKKQMFLPVVQKVGVGQNSASHRVIVGANETKFYAIDSLVGVYVSTKNSVALANAKSVNASIVADNNQEQNQKDLNDIYCVFVEDDSLVTSSQINYIQYLALMCPFTEGLSVYQARGLMRAWDDSTFYYNDCESSIPDEYSNNSRFASGTESNSGNAIALMVYPNPSNGTLNVKINSSNCIFEVYDVIGKQVMSRKLSDGETKVDLSSLNNGTYLYKITENNVVIKADKLIINK
jgi:hypothetical protein